MALEAGGVLDQLCGQRHRPGQISAAPVRSSYKSRIRVAPADRAAILSPHLDDAVLSAWSVLAGERDVVVVNVFAGVPESRPAPRWDRLAGAVDSRPLMKDRLGEDAAALALAGRTAKYLDFLERQYRDADPTPDELSAALEDCVPAAAALYAPAGIGGHRDHVLVRDAALRLARRAGLPITLYAELPYAVLYGWPHWVTGAARHPHVDNDHDWEDALASAGVPRDALVPHVRRLDPEQAAAKLRAMKRYRTQFPLLNRGPIGQLEHPSVLPFEVVWTVDSALAWPAPLSGRRERPTPWRSA